MGEKDNRTRMILNNGTTSLILIAVVLLMVTFSLLALSSAGMKWRMAEKMAERSVLYYETRNHAVLLAQQLPGTEERTGSREELIDCTNERIRGNARLHLEGDKLLIREELSEEQMMELELAAEQDRKTGYWYWKAQREYLTAGEGSRHSQTVTLFAAASEE